MIISDKAFPRADSEGLHTSTFVDSTGMSVLVVVAMIGELEGGSTRTREEEWNLASLPEQKERTYNLFEVKRDATYNDS